MLDPSLHAHKAHTPPVSKVETSAATTKAVAGCIPLSVRERRMSLNGTPQKSAQSTAGTNSIHITSFLDYSAVDAVSD